MCSEIVTTLDNSLALSIHGAGKCYEIYEHPKHRLMQSLFRGRRQYYHEFWALSDVSFDVAKGECVGLVGRNGSGKSTLLQIVCGTLMPTNGTVCRRGSMAAMLELGSGFNPQFTGRENVYLNATIFGLSREEIDAKFDEIAEFADIGEFMEQKVSMYSSGMYARLAFAVYSAFDPDILVVDEILAVGDTKFQAKCFRRLAYLQEQGTSILLVTHALDQILRLCSRAVLLDHGSMLMDGPPKDVINTYMDLLFKGEISPRKPIEATPAEDHGQSVVVSAADDRAGEQLPFFKQLDGEDLFASREVYNPYEHRWGDGQGLIVDYLFMSEDGRPYPSSVPPGSSVSLFLKIRALSRIERPVFGLSVKTKDGLLVSASNTLVLDVAELQRPIEAGQCAIVKLCFNVNLNPAEYFLSVGLAGIGGSGEPTPHDRRYDSIMLNVVGRTGSSGIVDMGIEMSSFSWGQETST